MGIINLYINMVYLYHVWLTHNNNNKLLPSEKIVSAIISVNIADNCINVREVVK